MSKNKFNLNEYLITFMLQNLISNEYFQDDECSQKPSMTCLALKNMLSCPFCLQLTINA